MTDPSRTSSHHRIVIAGGGTAGLSVAASLLRESPQLDVAVIEPSDDHYYQPGWTLVGGGDMRARDTHRHEADVMPDKATWIKDAVAGFAPDDNHVKLASGAGVSYDFLVVALGLQLVVCLLQRIARRAAAGHSVLVCVRNNNGQSSARMTLRR